MGTICTVPMRTSFKGWIIKGLEIFSHAENITCFICQETRLSGSFIYLLSTHSFLLPFLLPHFLSLSLLCLCLSVSGLEYNHLPIGLTKHFLPFGLFFIILFGILSSFTLSKRSIHFRLLFTVLPLKITQYI